jgi:hypothetical protein
MHTYVHTQRKEGKGYMEKSEDEESRSVTSAPPFQSILGIDANTLLVGATDVQSGLDDSDFVSSRQNITNGQIENLCLM